MESNQTSTLHTKKHFVWIIVSAVAALLLLRIIVNLWLDKSHKEPNTSVATASVKTKDVPVYFSALGTVTPQTTVTVRTQISGTLTHVFFNDGQMVKAGDVLAEVDDRIYQAQLLQFEGALTRDNALLTNAKIDLKRYQNLYRSKSVSEQTLNTQQSLVKQYEGATKIDEGQINAVKTNISYCKITSPVSGRIGIGIVNQGNLVQPSDTTGIAVITTLNPIDVIFSLPEDNLPSIATAFHAGNKLIVEAYGRDQHQLLATGELTAIDNQVNTATGTVNYKATFDNDNNVLFPSEFVTIKLRVTTLKNATVIPAEAIQQGTNGPYVYRYNTNQTVSLVPVKTSVSEGENTVITEGLAPNQIVVTAGTDKLSDGDHVMIAGKTA